MTILVALRGRPGELPLGPTLMCRLRYDKLKANPQRARFGMEVADIGMAKNSLSDSFGELRPASAEQEEP
jgi:hypothetical protein